MNQTARSIPLFTATCIVVANMIGTGVFTSLGFQVLGTPAGFAIAALWIIGGVCALCGAFAYAELASALPRSGGEYHFLTETYHSAVGFLAGWLSITVGFAAPIALASMAFGTYMHAVIPNLPATALSLAAVAVVTLVHLGGNSVGSKFQNAATVLKVALIVTLIGAGFFAPKIEGVSFLPTAEGLAQMTTAPFAVSLIYVMYAYSGWNASAYIVGEVKNAARNVPLSLVIGTAFVLVLYVLVNTVFLAITPVAEMAGKPEVAHVAATRIFGESGGRIMSGLICFGLISSISAMTWIGPRVTMTMGEDWNSLGLFARRTSRGVPAIALITQSAIVAILIISATFETVLTAVQLCLTVSSTLTVLGVYVLRRRRPDLPRPVRAWGYPVTPAIFLLVSGWMLWHIATTKHMESLGGLSVIVSGLIVYALSKRRTQAVAQDRKTS